MEKTSNPRKNAEKKTKIRVEQNFEVLDSVYSFVDAGLLLLSSWRRLHSTFLSPRGVNVSLHSGPDQPRTQM